MTERETTPLLLPETVSEQTPTLLPQLPQSPSSTSDRHHEGVRANFLSPETARNSNSPTRTSPSAWDGRNGHDRIPDVHPREGNTTKILTVHREASGIYHHTSHTLLIIIILIIIIIFSASTFTAKKTEVPLPPISGPPPSPSPPPFFSSSLLYGDTPLSHTPRFPPLSVSHPPPPAGLWDPVLVL